MLDKYGLKRDRGTNVLGIVVFSIALGVVINHLGEEGVPLKNFFQALNSATMVLINVVIWWVHHIITYPRKYCGRSWYFRWRLCSNRVTDNIVSNSIWCPKGSKNLLRWYYFYKVVNFSATYHMIQSVMVKITSALQKLMLTLS